MYRLFVRVGLCSPFQSPNRSACQTQSLAAAGVYRRIFQSVHRSERELLEADWSVFLPIGMKF